MALGGPQKDLAESRSFGTLINCRVLVDWILQSKLRSPSPASWQTSFMDTSGRCYIVMYLDGHGPMVRNLLRMRHADYFVCQHIQSLFNNNFTCIPPHPGTKVPSNSKTLYTPFYSTCDLCGDGA